MQAQMRICTKLFILLALAAATVACNKNSQQPAAGGHNAASTSTSSSAKRYQLRGKVVSVDKRANMVNIDGEEIPGFMGAMTMPYTVKPASELDKLSPGEAITADIVVQDDNSWIENIKPASH
jgi:protein SCO1